MYDEFLVVVVVCNCGTLHTFYKDNGERVLALDFGICFVSVTTDIFKLEQDNRSGPVFDLSFNPGSRVLCGNILNM